MRRRCARAIVNVSSMTARQRFVNDIASVAGKRRQKPNRHESLEFKGFARVLERWEVVSIELQTL